VPKIHVKIQNSIFKTRDNCSYLGLNGGQCVVNGPGFICNCPVTFTGNRCEAPGKKFLRKKKTFFLTENFF